MDSRKYAFLKAVLGEDGAASLKKASDRLGDLEGVVVPRAIMAWLGVVARGDYEGELPGVEDSYLDFAKNDNGTYSGSISIGEGVFPFHNATVFQLAASMAMALGSGEIQIDGNFKDVDLVRLGKSIDLLAKAKYVSVLDTLTKAIPGPPQAPTQAGAPTPANPPTKQKDKGPKPPKGQMPKKPPIQAKAPKHIVPKSKVQLPKVKNRTFALPAKAMKNECQECGRTLIKNEQFTGCLCFSDMARYVKLAKHGNDYSISFLDNKMVDEDAIAAILNTLGVGNG